MPNREFVNLIYSEDAEPIEYLKEEVKKKKPLIKKFKKIRVNWTSVMILSVLIAVAAGLWYAFILNFISSGGR